MSDRNEHMEQVFRTVAHHKLHNIKVAFDKAHAALQRQTAYVAEDVAQDCVLARIAIENAREAIDYLHIILNDNDLGPGPDGH